MKWEALHSQLQSIAKRRATLDAEEAACLVRAEAMQIWRQCGYVHLGEYLERELGYGPRAGMDRMRVARALVALPLTAEAMAKGLPYSAVRELVRVMTPATEHAWLERIRGCNLREVEKAVQGHGPGSMPVIHRIRPSRSRSRASSYRRTSRRPCTRRRRSFVASSATTPTMMRSTMRSPAG
jgi:hypothetical protein